MRVKATVSTQAEDEQRLAFFMSHSPSEIVRLARWFHDLIDNDVAGLYEWKQAKVRAAAAATAQATYITAVEEQSKK